MRISVHTKYSEMLEFCTGNIYIEISRYVLKTIAIPVRTNYTPLFASCCLHICCGVHKCDLKAGKCLAQLCYFAYKFKHDVLGLPNLQLRILQSLVYLSHKYITMISIKVMEILLLGFMAIGTS